MCCFPVQDRIFVPGHYEQNPHVLQPSSSESKVYKAVCQFFLACTAISGVAFLLTVSPELCATSVVLGLITLSILALAVIGPDNVAEMIEKRFFSNETAVSDQTRIIQIKALMREYDQFPLLGKGLGGYTKESIRDEKLMHSYEVQWAAFLMQFG